MFAFAENHNHFFRLRNTAREGVVILRNSFNIVKGTMTQTKTCTLEFSRNITENVFNNTITVNDNYYYTFGVKIFEGTQSTTLLFKTGYSRVIRKII